MANNIDDVVDKAEGQLKRLKTELGKLHKSILKNGEELNKIFDATGVSGGKELQKQIDSLNKKLKKLNETKEQSIVTNGKVKVQESALAKFQLMKNKQRKKEIKEYEQLRKSELKLASDREKAFDKADKELDKKVKKELDLKAAIAKRNKKIDDDITKANKKRVQEADRIESNKKALDKQRIASIKATTKALKDQEAATKKAKENSIAIAREENKQFIKNEQAITKANKARLQEADAIERNKKALDNQKRASIEASRPYQKLITQHKQAKKVLEDATVAYGKHNNKTKQAQREYDKLTKRVNQANKATSNFSKTGLGSMARGFRNLLGAFGIMGGIQMFASAIQNTFQRVREFDKSMQNLAGVFRTTREELKPLEEVIVSVAGESIKTSREVATLAESLATLGKTPDEIKKLLKPVVDLGIGLNASSEDAGEFLIQMLNAFGASDDEAMKYADTIATIRTSTTLDFQKMRDSFQYIAPISRLLGKDLAYTGSVVGILADNGLKAQQAGRVLGTSLQKLATQGLSLDDALNQINEATSKGVKEVELLAMANKLFGAEGAKIGIVLAENKNLIDENTQSIRDNSGALKDLVEQQLESLDAKLLVLDASWEELILRIENGRGVFSNAFKDIIQDATDFLNLLSDINQVTEIIGETRDYNLTDFIFIPKGIYKAYTDMTRLRDATKEFQAIQKEFETTDLTNLNEVTSLIDIWTEMRDEVKDNEGAVKSLDYFLNKLKETERSIYESARDADDERRKNEKDKRNGLSEEGLVLESLRKKLKELSDEKASLGSVSELQNKDYLTWQELTKEINKTKSAIEDLIGKKKKLKGDSKERKKAEVGFEQTGLESGIQSPEFLGKSRKEMELILQIEKWRLTTMKGTGMMYLDQASKIEDIERLINELPDDKIIISPKNSEEAQKLIDKLKKLETTKEIFKTVTDTFSEMFDIDMSKFDFLFDDATNSVAEWADLSKELIGSVLDASLQRYEIELQEAQRTRDLMLNNDLASEEQKEMARREFDEKERKIKTEQAKHERENNLIKIAVDTAVGVATATAAYLSNPATAIALPLILPIIIGTGLAQAALVASQPLPQFFDGVEDSKYQGWATKDEKGAELHFDKYGNIKDFGQNKGAKKTFVERGDTIIPAMQTKSILENFNANDMQRAIFDMNMISNGEILNQKSVDRSLLNKLDELSSSNKQVWREVKELASRPISNKVKVEIEDKRPY